jgi:hypothetical protein
MALLVGIPMSAAAKCKRAVRSQPQPTAIVLDGRQTAETEINRLNLSNDSIEAVHILCWNPADSTFARAQTVVGVNVIHIMTKGFVDRLVAELYRASEAASRPPSTQFASGPPDASRIATEDGEVVVELSADGAQWSATLKQGAMVHRCVLDVGTPLPATASERQRTCAFAIAEGEKHVLNTEG